MKSVLAQSLITYFTGLTFPEILGIISAVVLAVLVLFTIVSLLLIYIILWERNSKVQRLELRHCQQLNICVLTGNSNKKSGKVQGTTIVSLILCIV